MSTQVGRCGEIHATDGDVKFLCDFNPVGPGLGVCIGIIYSRYVVLIPPTHIGGFLASGQLAKT